MISPQGSAHQLNDRHTSPARGTDCRRYDATAATAVTETITRCFQYWLPLPTVERGGNKRMKLARIATNLTGTIRFRRNPPACQYSACTSRLRVIPPAACMAIAKRSRYDREADRHRTTHVRPTAPDKLRFDELHAITATQCTASKCWRCVSSKSTASRTRPKIKAPSPFRRDLDLLRAHSHNAESDPDSRTESATQTRRLVHSQRTLRRLPNVAWPPCQLRALDAASVFNRTATRRLGDVGSALRTSWECAANASE